MAGVPCNVLPCWWPAIHSSGFLTLLRSSPGTFMSPLVQSRRHQIQVLYCLLEMQVLPKQGWLHFCADVT